MVLRIDCGDASRPLPRARFPAGGRNHEAARNRFLGSVSFDAERRHFAELESNGSRWPNDRGPLLRGPSEHRLLQRGMRIGQSWTRYSLDAAAVCTIQIFI